MSRYDGLIIPRSYNEYINKSDPLTLAQALQQNNVLSGAVAAGDNKAVKSGAVAVALAKYGKIYKGLDILNADKGTAIALVSGEDNCSKIVEALNANEVFNDYFNNSPANSKWGLPTPSGISYVLIRFEKLDNNYCIISAYETDTNTEYFRISKNGTLGAWQINAKQTEIAECVKQVVVDDSTETGSTTLAELLSLATAQMNGEQPYVCKLRGKGTGMYVGNIMTYQKSATPNYAMAQVIQYNGYMYKCSCLNGTWTITQI